MHYKSHCLPQNFINCVIFFPRLCFPFKYFCLLLFARHIDYCQSHYDYWRNISLSRNLCLIEEGTWKKTLWTSVLTTDITLTAWNLRFLHKKVFRLFIIIFLWKISIIIVCRKESPYWKQTKLWHKDSSVYVPKI